MKRRNRKKLSLSLAIILVLQLLAGAMPGVEAAELSSPVINKSSATFNYQGDGSKSSVKVAGNFTNWEDGALDMTKGDGNVWSLKVDDLSDGKHQYKFIVDGEWIKDPLNPDGGDNSVFQIGEATTERTVTLVGDLQTELGADVDWKPEATETIMEDKGNGFYEFTAELPAGKYEYKIAINQSWGESYGKDGGNIPLELSEATTVTFYYHDGTHVVADSTTYNKIADEKQPRLVGSIQPAIDAGDEWSPSTSTAFFTDDNFDNVYTYTADVPKGNYEYKVVLGNDWGEEYPGGNAALNVLSDATITFQFNAETKDVSTDYSPEGSDGAINKDQLLHNSWEEAYRAPFGAVKEGETVTLRLSAKKDDLTKVELYLKNQNTGTSKLVSMEKAATTDGMDFFEADVTPEDKGLYGYKFIVRDGAAKAEYGEDTKQGSKGKAVDGNAELYQLTVFDPGFQTPDWMKEAVVYQIFPDRFYNGNENNDDAKKYARGLEPIEQKEWAELPDNPRLADRSGYEGDGIWSNDFFGGDVKGIHEKLDYIESLGVNTIYLNPIAEAASNHKYDATDWKTIDPLFGTPEEFEAFTKELEKRDMHLIMDGVFNHVGDDSIYFDRYGKYDVVGAYEYWSLIYDLMNDKGLSEEDAKTEARKQLEKEGQTFNDEYGFHNWFNIKNEIVKDENGNERYDYQAWWGYDSLPEIKSVSGDAVDYASELNNKKFSDYIMYDEDSAAKSWITNGASGWRLDVANEVDMEFWREFRDELKSKEVAGAGATLKEGEEPLILGEIWDDASKYFLGDQYDSVMNYRFEGAILDFLKNGNAASADEKLRAVQEDYPDEAFRALMNLMGSHDTPRAVYVLGGGTDTYERAEFDPKYDHELGVKRLKLAAVLQMGYPGAPTIYYGDEAGVTGSKDPDDRRTYPWGGENESLVKHYQNAGDVRTANADLLAYGDLKTLHADGDVYVYARTNAEGAAVIAVNRGNDKQTVELDVKGLVKNNISFTDGLSKEYSATVKNGVLTVSVPAMTGRMMVADSGQNFELPTAVSELKVTVGEGSADLSWKGDAAQYKVYRSTLQGAMYEEVTLTDKTSIKVDGLTNGQSYYFAVTAVDADGNESTITETKDAAIPHYEWKDGSYDITNVNSVDDAVLDLSQTFMIEAGVKIEGATESGQAEGLMAKLQIKQGGDWIDSKATYKGQGGDGNGYNMFKGTFQPIETGTYSYRLAFTTDRGETWKTTNTEEVTLTQNPEDKKAPADAVNLEEPLKESGQVTLNWSLEGADNPYLFGIERDGKTIELIQDAEKVSYTDFAVENGKTYEYRVVAYDQSGNKTVSNAVSITPDIVMVDVTFKVHAPDYTPLSAKVTMPGSQNGWSTSAWEMSRNGAVSPDWELTKTFPEGTVLTYKYAKGESWDQEGLADHTRSDKTDDDVSYYGYGAIGTDLSVTVTNQGGNKMVVEDEILRWIDMPVVVNSPENGAEVEGDTVTFKGNAIKEGVLTINGENVNVNDDMTFSHEVKLDNGENEIPITIEPSEENKAEIFNNDGGAIAKNTKEYTWKVTKGGEPAKEPVRLSGKDRFSTAVDISKKGWEKADTVVLANGNNFADALAGGPYAYKLDAPILLTGEDRLTPVVKEEIKRLGAKKVIILGGEGAVSSYVAYELRGLNVKVDRISGKDRFETAANISARMGASDKAVVVNGLDFPDALSGASYAAEQGYPILFTLKDKVPSSTKKALDSKEASIVVGGSGVVEENVLTSLPDPKRVSGKDRFGTAAAVATELNPSQHVFIATGMEFADALSGSVLAAKSDAAMLLVQPNKLPESTAKAMKELKANEFTILGGTGAVSEEVVKEIVEK
ncbi:alpha amylase N-terminal ig-like domain-containing protein [Guptibacillus algicola]|uniref:alpha amylase N-terminal ig-like domain-containing protein n=1 Tax=Guptibacillus algicola TaxID=225844 RepID=UPI001CD4D84C|nr:alpha amylase N-terminal ig-like domain-containing protein [Alkalihalobacillus algicola]MCA0987105.1 alpha amylase N-terminal ig-like domain-containing protein [Alkalihalobacillus algicola]